MSFILFYPTLTAGPIELKYWMQVISPYQEKS